jgi:hypothetical protein
MSDRPLLWLPSSAVQQPGHARTGESDGPSPIVYDTIGELTSGVPDLPGVLAAKLLAFAPETLLAIVSNVNARLSHDGMSNQSLHAQLEANLVYPELLAGLHSIRSQRTTQQSVIFTRRSLLLLAKINLGLRGDRTGGDANEREIGTCVLIINELLQPTGPQSDDLLVVDIMANWDLFMPPDVPHVVARFRLLMRRLMTSTDPRVIRARERLSLDQLLFDGLTYDEFQALLLGVYAIITTAVGKWEAPSLTIEPPLPPWVGDEVAVRSFFARRSHPIASFKDWRYGSSWTVDQLRALLLDPVFLYDVTAFRQRPFVAVGDRYVLPDYHLAFERLTFGSYWTIFDALSGDDRLLFSGAWGVAFEEYIISLLSSSYPASEVLSNVFTPNVKFPGGEIDAVLDFGDHVIVVEVKSTLLPVLVRAARDVAGFASWVEERLVGTVQEKGGLRQLAGAAGAVRNGALGGSRAIVYPVLVTDELSFQSLGVNRYLGRVFEELVADRTGIEPLSVITTDELEKLLPCVSDGVLTWRAVLDRRAGDRDGWLWVGQAMMSELHSSGRAEEARRHDVLVAEYQAFLGTLKAEAP